MDGPSRSAVGGPATGRRRLVQVARRTSSAPRSGTALVARVPLAARCAAQTGPRAPARETALPAATSRATESRSAAHPSNPALAHHRDRGVRVNAATAATVTAVAAGPSRAAVAATTPVAPTASNAAEQSAAATVAAEPTRATSAALCALATVAPITAIATDRLASRTVAAASVAAVTTGTPISTGATGSTVAAVATRVIPSAEEGARVTAVATVTASAARGTSTSPTALSARCIENTPSESEATRTAVAADAEVNVLPSGYDDVRATVVSVTTVATNLIGRAVTREPTEVAAGGGYLVLRRRGAAIGTRQAIAAVTAVAAVAEEQAAIATIAASLAKEYGVRTFATVSK